MSRLICQSFQYAVMRVNSPLSNAQANHPEPSVTEQIHKAESRSRRFSSPRQENDSITSCPHLQKASSSMLSSRCKVHDERVQIRIGELYDLQCASPHPTDQKGNVGFLPIIYHASTWCTRPGTRYGGGNGEIPGKAIPHHIRRTWTLPIRGNVRFYLKRLLVDALRKNLNHGSTQKPMGFSNGSFRVDWFWFAAPPFALQVLFLFKEPGRSF